MNDEEIGKLTRDTVPPPKPGYWERIHLAFAEVDRERAAVDTGPQQTEPPILTALPNPMDTTAGPERPTNMDVHSPNHPTELSTNWLRPLLTAAAVLAMVGLGGLALQQLVSSSSVGTATDGTPSDEIDPPASSTDTTESDGESSTPATSPEATDQPTLEDTESPAIIAADWCGARVLDRGAIQFEAGTIQGTVSGAIVRGDRDLYTIEAAAGQRMQLVLTSLEDNAELAVQNPSGSFQAAQTTDAEFIVSEDGINSICIGGTRGNASYELTATIHSIGSTDSEVTTEQPEQVVVRAEWCGAEVFDRGEISFAPGDSEASVSGVIIRGDRDVYSIEAGAGQTMALTLSTIEDNGAVFAYSPSETDLTPKLEQSADPDREPGQAEAVVVQLPDSGVYQLCVGGVRGNVSYTLTVSIN